jgi:hypothetical protein
VSLRRSARLSSGSPLRLTVARHSRHTFSARGTSGGVICGAVGAGDAAVREVPRQRVICVAGRHPAVARREDLCCAVEVRWVAEPFVAPSGCDSSVCGLVRTAASPLASRTFEGTARSARVGKRLAAARRGTLDEAPAVAQVHLHPAPPATGTASGAGNAAHAHAHGGSATNAAATSACDRVASCAGRKRTSCGCRRQPCRATPEYPRAAQARPECCHATAARNAP